MLPKVIVSNSQKDLPLSRPSVSRMVREVLSFKKKFTNEVTIYFVSEKKICMLHKEFFNDSSATDCISLPMDENNLEHYHILGEIFVCPKIAKDYVHKKGGDIYEEVSLYVVHGLLHLMGFDDIDPGHKKKMKYQERKIMAHLLNHNLKISF